MACYKKIFVIFLIFIFFLSSFFSNCFANYTFSPFLRLTGYYGYSQYSFSQSEHWRTIFFRAVDVDYYLLTFILKQPFSNSISYCFFDEFGDNYSLVNHSDWQYSLVSSTGQAQIDISYQDYNYICIFYHVDYCSNVRLETPDFSSGLGYTTNHLATSISDKKMWNIIGELIPYIAVVTLFALGLYFLRRMIKGVSNGKGKF